MAKQYCGHCGGRCFCGAQQASKGLTENQSRVNRTIEVPVAPMTLYQEALALGAIPPDMSFTEFINRPAETALSVQEQTIEW